MHCRPRVLIVEDDVLIADLTEELLTGNGFEVCGVVNSVKDALDVGRWQAPDLALIDYGLKDGERGTEVGTKLRERSKLGILYVTGQNSLSFLQDAIGEAYLVKPYLSIDLVCSLEIVLGLALTGKLKRSLPRGLQLLS